MVGTVLLLFAGAVTSVLSGHARAPGLANAAAIHGYTTAFWWAAAIVATGLALAITIIPARDTPCFQPAAVVAREAAVPA